MRFVSYTCFSAALALILTTSTLAQRGVDKSKIVSTEWLATHLHDSNLVLLQVGEKDEYTTAHIPGAQFISLQDISTPRGQGLSLELPPEDQLESLFQKLGVSNNSRIIVYFSKDWITPTARVFMTLDYLGLGDRSAILDGGLPAWRAENRPVTDEVTQPRAGKLSAHPNTKLVVDAAWVNANLNNPKVRILDARASQFYTGAEVGRMKRGGHIPNAKNIPYSSLVDQANRFKSPSALQQLFDNAEARPDNTVATYCHVGQQASLLYFVARYLGYDAHLYDGSFEEWSGRTDLPVEKSEPEKTKP